MKKKDANTIQKAIYFANTCSASVINNNFFCFKFWTHTSEILTYVHS